MTGLVFKNVDDRHWQGNDYKDIKAVTDKDGKVIKPAVFRHVSMTSVAVGKELPFALIFMTHMNIDFDGAVRRTRAREASFPRCALSTFCGPSRSARYGRRTPESGRWRYGQDAPEATVPEASCERVKSTYTGLCGSGRRIKPGAWHLPCAGLKQSYFT